MDVVIGGDHGKGRFCMVKKLLLHYKDESKPTKDFVFQNGQIKSTKDSLEVLKKSIGFPIAESMAQITAGSQFIVFQEQENGALQLAFS